MAAPFLLLALVPFAASPAPVPHGALPEPGPTRVLVEVESLPERGGWVVDQQFMDRMGSPYLLAHGLGVPVQDATGPVAFERPGDYRVWVRTRDWVAPWDAPGAPGRFRVLVDGAALEPTFGTVGVDWAWHDGGVVTVGAEATLTLHDLTGFEGRCDAVLFTSDLDERLPDGGPELAALRAEHLGWTHAPADAGDYDLVVVGGGVAGTCAAISAARQGLQVALIQDRPVLGGNGSSEVRVWPEGHTNLRPFPHVGDIVEELIPPKPKARANAAEAEIYADARKLELVRAEPNVTLLLEHRMIAADHAAGEGEEVSIRSVVAQHVRSGARKRVTGRLFLDSTGDGVLGALVGADFELTREGHMGASNLWNVDAIERNEYELLCECEDDDPLSLNFTQAETEQPFPRVPWAVDMSARGFPGREGYAAQWRRADDPLSNLGDWFWESGFDEHPIDDMEQVRDYNLRAMYGAWDTLKNVDGKFPNQRLRWAAYIAGKRESRRLLGDVVVTADDFRAGKAWTDPAFPCTWHIDLHGPDERFEEEGEAPFISVATNSPEYHYEGPYWAPYRALYSRNVSNLFMAGRDISVSHDGLGAVRVMRTCGMMGEAVGRAAWIAVRHETTPRGVYEDHLELFLELQRTPGAARRDGVEGELVVPPGAWRSIPAAELEGLVVDDTEAVFTGRWSNRGSLRGYVGDTYWYSNDPAATATFPIDVPRDGFYEVRLAWQPHANRAAHLQARVRSASGESIYVLDQTRAGEIEDGFGSLGRFHFMAGAPGHVLLPVHGAGGLVHADAVQVLWRP